MKYKLEAMRHAGKINRNAIDHAINILEPGISLKDLDLEIEEFIRSHNGCTPSFKGYHGYPAASCLSVNEVAVHGIPSDYTLRPGDLLTIDVGTQYDGYHADAAESIVIPSTNLSQNICNLISATRQILDYQLGLINDGLSLPYLASKTRQFADSKSVSIISKLGGHGIGKNLHEPPFIANSPETVQNGRLKAGQTICLEPVITYGDPAIVLDPDGWTYRTVSRAPVAHFEHTILITDHGYEKLS